VAFAKKTLPKRDKACFIYYCTQATEKGKQRNKKAKDFPKEQIKKVAVKGLTPKVNTLFYFFFLAFPNFNNHYLHHYHDQF